MPNIGVTEIAILLIVALIIFGPKRLPELGRSLGRGMREFKDSISGKDDDERERPVELTPGDDTQVVRTAGAVRDHDA